MAAKLKRNDEVIVLTGKDKGKRGKVLVVRPDGRLIVAGVNMIKKHQKPNPMAQKAGGIIEKEALFRLQMWRFLTPRPAKAIVWAST